ncbi:MAG: MliC family protein [Candidatus Eiseniibacteriota bacterium]
MLTTGLATGLATGLVSVLAVAVLIVSTFATGCARKESSTTTHADSADAPSGQPGAASPDATTPTTPTAPASSTTTRTFVFECEGTEFEVRANEDTAWVFMPGRGVALPHVPAASGAKYEAAGIVFWSHGDEAMIEVDGRTYKACRNNPAKAVWADAKLRGIDFRATGNEPGWMLEIADGARIDLVLDYGATSVHTPAPPPTVDGRAVYHAVTEAHDLTVTIEPTPCQDSMSGADFPSRVTVLIDGKTYKGCGRALH